LIQTFVESCLDFEVAHLSVLMVQRLPYLEIPTLFSLAAASNKRMRLLTSLYGIFRTVFFSQGDQVTYYQQTLLTQPFPQTSSYSYLFFCTTFNFIVE